MRAIYRLIVPIIVLGWAAYGQTLAPSFRFLDPIKPGDSLTVDGTDMATITAVALKAAGKPDLAATAVQATSTNVKFTVPLTASGIYTVALSSSKIDSIPLTVTPVQANGGSGVCPTPPLPQSHRARREVCQPTRSICRTGSFTRTRFGYT